MPTTTVRPLLALALLALLAPGALAQAAPTDARQGLLLALQPAAGEAAPGGSLSTVAVLKNPGDHAVVVGLSAAGGAFAKVAFERQEVRVPPREAVRVPVTIHVAHEAKPGPHPLAVHAQDANGTPVAKASFALRVVSTLPPPQVSPPSVDAEVPAGETRRIPLKVTNPSSDPRRVDARVEAPPLWRAAVEPATLDLPGGGSGELTLVLQPREGAREAKAVVRIGNATSHAEVPVLLRPLPPGAVTLRVHPAEAELPLGGRVVLDVVVANGGPAPVSPPLRLDLPKGVRGSLPPDAPPVPPGGSVTLPLVLEADPDAAELPVQGTVRLGRPGVEPATFLLRLVPAPPAEDALATAAAEDAEGASTALVVAGVAAGVGGVASVLAWANRRWPALAAAPLAALYTRLRPSGVLDQPTRERILALVRERPGVTFGDLRRATGMGAGTLTYHARVLERAGVLHSVPDGQVRRFFTLDAGRVAPTPPLDERAVQALRERGPMSAGELARALGVSRQALHYHLKRMLREGRLVARPEGRELVVAVP